MKPLKLKMTAFLGFKEETLVDFSSLYEDKIFLITGPTGSGKTSIFDAVAYALYGEGSGETRTKAKCFRSQLAGDKTNMEVELEFEVRGELYHVRRVETVKGVNKAYFYKVDDPETLWTKIREVNQEIETIVGLNLDQFKKIVMIPQGEFREFLTAGTKDKSDILKQLFSTEQYELFQRKIKESFDVVVNKDKDLVRRFTQIIEDVGIDHQDIEQGPDALKETLKIEEDQVQCLQEEEITKQNIVKSLEKDLEEAKANNFELQKYEKVREEYQNLEKRRPEIEEKTHKLLLLRKVSHVASFERQLRIKEKEVEKTKEELEEVEKDKVKLTEQMEHVKTHLSSAFEKEKTLDQKKERRTELIKWMDKSKQLKDVSEKLDDVNKKVSALEQRLSNLKAKSNELNEVKTNEQKAITLKYEAEQEKSSLLMAQSEIENKLKMYRTIYNKVARKEAQVKKIELLIKQSESFEKQLKESKAQLQKEKEKRNENYALLLRDELRDEEPCPVCGSIDHPLKDKVLIQSETQNLSQLEKQVEKEEKILQDNAYQLRYEQQTSKELEEEIQVLIKENNMKNMGLEELKTKGKELKEESESLFLKLKSLEINLKTRLKEIEHLKKQKDSLTEDLKDEDQIILEKSKADEIKNELRGELKSLEAEGVPKDSTNMNNEVSEIESEIKAIEENKRKAQDDFDQVQRKIENLLGRETALNKALVQALEMAKKYEVEFYHTLEKAELIKETYLEYANQIAEIQGLERETNQFNQIYYEKKGLYENLKDDGEKRTLRELDPIVNAQEEAIAQLKEKQDQVKSKAIIVHNLRTAHERLGETYKEYQENKKELTVLQSLYDTANLGMGFETFVQSYYFEGILIRANQRLKKMSEGRYQLRRRNETENRREKIGLGLNVFDEYSGRERDVMSLSGGESFKASLSLALGLSDFIESHKGSVNLGTIFIDEGFGSLDQDSLDNALECLLELNLSGRIVGIISHVTELKDRIPGRIEVTSKPGQGSKIVVNGGVN